MPSLTEARSAVPWETVVERVCTEVVQAVPSLETTVRELPRKVFGLDSGFFYMPIAQAMEWGEKHADWLEEVAATFGLGHLYYVLHDQLVDRGRLAPRQAVLMDTALALYLRCGAQLGTGSEHFLLCHGTGTAVYAEALLRDIAHNEQPEQGYRADDVFRLGEKAAPGILALVVVAKRCRRTTDTTDLSRAVIDLCSGLQLLDDLQDLREDWSHGNVTFPASLGIKALGPADASSPIFDSCTADDVLDALYLSGGAANVLRLALRCLERARASLSRTDAGVVLSLVNMWAERAAMQLARADERPVVRADLG
ncbi:hypothetical protein HRW14_06620 [Streptomyces lunaelactis]|uniref:hypothetical protein n=1 Tax=Streptomyces lunaelactis TaxID=1535768 RepID=UPI001584FDEE|nr:hypothetical protein [Streptomyces lunaelactis]NUK49972.1 hypothetical protein [Streptomyces lunaelactis]NUK64232.1 hypothetical protein [Streptomyces lunaelactis]